MIKQKSKNGTWFSKLPKTSRLTAVLIAISLGLSAVAVPLVRADRFEEEIKILSQENAQKQQAKDQLGAQAAGLSDQINRLQAQITNLQTQIAANQAQSVELHAQITAAEAELARQKHILGENIRQMYLEGKMSTLEMLASSKDLSEYVDKEQYRNSVKDKIKLTMDKINALRRQLADQKATLDKLIEDQQIMRSQLGAQQAEQNRLLSLNQAQQDDLNGQIKGNSAKIAELRSQQAAENARHFRGITVVAGSNGRDSYPDAWRNSPQDTLLDNWGMYNRECVSYTAWKVFNSGRHMPFWGGVGNANQWDDNARAAGIAVDGNPRVGDVAIAHWGYYGHAMYVESVNGDGTINVSQYNWDFNGTYSEAYNFPASGLTFIHF